MFDKIRRFFTANLSFKLLAFGFAVILWVWVSLGQTESELPMTVRLEVKNLPREMIRSSDLPNELDIKVSGTRTVLRSINPKQLRYVLDLTGSRPGSHLYKIYAPRIEGIPDGAQVTEISPSQVQLRLSSRKQKTVRVNPVLRGKPAEGREILGRTVVPEFVEVSGAEEEIDILSSVDTEIIDITDKNDSYSVRVGLDLVGRHVELIEQKEVQVNVYIGSPQVKRMFPGVPIEVIGTEQQYKLGRDRLDVQLQGPQDELAKINPEDLRLQLDATGLAPGTYTMDLEIILPEGMSFRNIERPKVKISIFNKKKIKKKKLKKKP